MKKIVIFLLLVFSVALYSEITIEHSEPYIAYRNSDLKLEISLVGNRQQVVEFKVYYRERGEVAYNIIDIDADSGQIGEYEITIPVSQYAQGLEYYMEVETGDGQLITYPAEQPTLNPIMVQVIDEDIETNFVILNDLEDIEEGVDFSLSISLFNIRDEIDLNTVKFSRNGKDVTKDLIITPTLLVYNVKKISDSFNFQVQAKKLDGEEIVSRMQTVSVKKKMFTYELPYNIRGNINYRGNTNSISYDNDNNQSTENSTNTHSTSVNVSGHNRFSRINSRIYLSSLETSERQAVNRYSLEAKFPYIALNVGDKTPYISEFTLNSTNIRGFGGKFYSKYFLLESYWGNSAREISTKASNGSYIPGTFRRESGALRLALGNQNAFQFGLNIVKNKDRISSLDYSDYYISVDAKDEDEVKQIINPVDNLVFSSDLVLSSPRKLFNFGAELAISAYNSNIIDGAISEDELEDDVDGDLPFDPESVDGFFIINKNTEPLSLTTSNLAYKLYSSMYIAGNLISINYNRVGSSFNSLAAKSINSDTQEFTAANNINFHNTVFVDFSYNRVSNNLAENLATTTEYSNYQVNSIFRKEKLPLLRVNFTKGRTSIKQNDDLVTNEDDSESVIIDESEEFRNIAFGGGIGYEFDKVPLMPFSLDLDYQNSLDEDDHKNLYEFEDNSFYARYRSKMTPIPLTTEVSYNFTKSTGFTSVISQAKDDLTYTKEYEEWKRSSMRIKFQYDLSWLKLSPFFDFRFTNNESEIDETQDNSYSATSFGFNYYPLRYTSVTSSLTLKNRSYDTLDDDYSAVNWYLNIIQKF